jgi:phage recombination protein Bet
MSEELVAVVDSTRVVQFDESQIDLLARTIAPDLNADELMLFATQCERTGLDPFSRQIYAWKQKGRVTFMTSIDGLRLIASRSGHYRGQDGPFWCGHDGRWTDVWLHEEPPVAAKVGVIRAGFEQPLYAVALWGEYGRNLDTWKTYPTVMLAKCAESLALRKAFPNEMSGVYTEEEMPAQPMSVPVQVERPSVETVELIVDTYEGLPLEAKGKITEWLASYSGPDGQSLGWTVDHDQILHEVDAVVVEKLLGVVERAVEKAAAQETPSMTEEQKAAAHEIAGDALAEVKAESDAIKEAWASQIEAEEGQAEPTPADQAS